MMIDYNFFGYKFHGNVWDTAIPTSHIDEVVIGAGIYDEIYVSVDTTEDDKNEKPKKWHIKTIMNPKFKNNLEAGSIDGSGYEVKGIQVYRREYGMEQKWLLIGDFAYDPDYNLYSFVDRLAQNKKTYEYAIVPVTDDILGEMVISSPVDVDFEGVFINDIKNNYQMEFDLEYKTIDHNRNYSISNPLNGKYPIVTYGNQDYRSGNIEFLPLSPEQKDSGGKKVDALLEHKLQANILEFLKRPHAKAIRSENGDIMIVATHSIQTQSKNGALRDLNVISFGFTEVGGLDFDTLSKGNLIGDAGKSKYTFDDYGNIIWSINYLPETEGARRKYRNSFPEKDYQPKNNKG